MADPRDPVILVHGLWMSGLEFGVLRQRLQTRHGFDVHVFSYPSMHGDVDEIVAELAAFAREQALRADYVPVLWGLSVAGEDGVAHVLTTLTYQFASAMAFCGARRVEELTPDLLTSL